MTISEVTILEENNLQAQQSEERNCGKGLAHLATGLAISGGLGFLTVAPVLGGMGSLAWTAYSIEDEEIGNTILGVSGCAAAVFALKKVYTLTSYARSSIVNALFHFNMLDPSIDRTSFRYTP